MAGYKYESFVAGIRGKRSGAEYKCLCPFHKEDTPSFSINLKSGFFKCWSCLEKGNIIAFVKKVYNLENYIEVVKFINEKLGYEDIVLNKDFLKKEEGLKNDFDILKENKAPTEKLLQNLYLVQKFKHNLPELINFFKTEENIFCLNEDMVISYSTYSIQFKKSDLIFDFGNGIQRIYYDSKESRFEKKIYLKNSLKLKGSFYEFNIDPQKQIFLCEGLATALSYVALGYNAIFCVNFENMLEVVKLFDTEYHRLWVSFDNVNKKTKEIERLQLSKQQESINNYCYQALDFENISTRSGYDFNDCLIEKGKEVAKEILLTKISKFDVEKHIKSQKIRIYSNKKNEYMYIFKNEIYQVNRRDSLIHAITEKLKLQKFDLKDIRKQVDTYIANNILEFDGYGYSPALPYTAEYKKLGGILINTYKESGIMTKSYDSLHNGSFARIQALIYHLVGYKLEYYYWFINFLANKIQNPEQKPHVGILFYSNMITGTGKSTLGKILKALFGKNLNAEVKQKSILEGRNSFFFNNLIWITEELDLEDGNIMQLIKTALTSDILTLKDKYLLDKEQENYSNGIFFSDKRCPIKLDEDDRRFVVFKCETKLTKINKNNFSELKFTETELDSLNNIVELNIITSISVVYELESFYRYLCDYSCTYVNAIATEDKIHLQKNSRTTEEEIYEDLAILLYSSIYEETKKFVVYQKFDKFLIPKSVVKAYLQETNRFNKIIFNISYSTILKELLKLKTKNEVLIFEEIIANNYYIQPLRKTEPCFLFKFTEKFKKEMDSLMVEELLEKKEFNSEGVYEKK